MDNIVQDRALNEQREPSLGVVDSSFFLIDLISLRKDEIVLDNRALNESGEPPLRAVE